ncbi:ABC transporter substrate-binding protein [Acuticoccus sp. M5D2P5]|uniref:ABC transporter substrate-binding protein n=1 Tax=Acuticoccus kalidii TaxID=2910977 RepID=UPI001F3519BE|nr:ABC transporter substrate-binding protein [Acuticoccus kalidii]MCF3936715.1 ABC transporter substrate-binding protein [Acuticoccus kalidii]
MNARSLLLAGLLASACAIPGAQAQDPVKIGMVTTLSGPAGYLGQDVRDGFNLAVELGEGKLGGVPVEVVVEDDNRNPGQARQIAEGMVFDEDIKIMTGIIFSNILNAVAPDVLDADAFYISPNAAPSNLAGAECDQNFFSVAWQNDALHEAAGFVAENEGYGSAFLLAANYQAGKDALTGFKRRFSGEVVGEIYTPIEQNEFSAELAQIRAANPEVVYQFFPGGAGIAFLRQYQQAGLLGEIPLVLGEPTGDAVILNAVGDAALGLRVGSHWNEDFDNEASQTFVAAWRERYGDRPITTYASQGYDTAHVIGAGLAANGGDMDDADTFREGVRSADFESVRGDFAFDKNHQPIQNWYAMTVVEGENGPKLRTDGIVAEHVSDVYVDECKM